jgi:hypothetical protein
MRKVGNTFFDRGFKNLSIVFLFFFFVFEDAVLLLTDSSFRFVGVQNRLCS